VVPQTQYIPVESMQKLVELNDSKGKIIFDKNLPQSVPGTYQLEQREKNLKQLQSQVASEWIGESHNILAKKGVAGEKDLAEKGFYYLKINWENEDCYLVFNVNQAMLDEWVTLNTDAKQFVLMNPMTGDISEAKSDKGKVRLQLQPEEIVFVKCGNNPINAPSHIYFENETGSKQIDGRWKVSFVDGGPVYPGNFDMEKLHSWTKGGDMETERFAGTASYTLDLNWDGASSGFLELGDVRDCARIFVNDKDYGVLIGPAYMVYLDNLKKGSNTITVEVSNVAANRIRDLDKRGVVWRKFYDINLVNIEYEPFDASGWEIRDAGLLGPVKLYETVED
jgi:hypothetical protein